MRMTTKAVVLAAAGSLLSSPAVARDGAAYVGAELGIMKADNTELDVGNVEDAVEIDYEFGLPDDGGWDGSLLAGYDFGGFRLEGEVSKKKARIEGLQSTIALPLGAPPGNYAARGQTEVMSYMLNAMADIGNDEGLSAFVGAGAGYADVDLENLRVFDNAPGFLNDGDKGFAWQLFAGLRQALSPNMDMHVKYRYFNGPGLDLDDGANQGSLDFSSHSVLGGITFNFGGRSAPPPPPLPPVQRVTPPPPPPPPPAPAMQTCWNGQRIPVTQICPAQPPAPTPEGERG